MNTLNIKEYLNTRKYYSGLNEGETLDDFLAQIGKYELITADKEQGIILRAQNGDTEALENLIASNLLFCVSAANQYQHKGLSLIELVKIAERSLAESIVTYDSAQDVKLIAYAVDVMRKDIAKELSNGKNKANRL